MKCKHRRTIATILGLIATFASVRIASAQGAGLYVLAGSTSQGEWLEVMVTPGPNLFTVNSVRLGGAGVRCAKSYQDRRHRPPGGGRAVLPGGRVSAL